MEDFGLYLVITDPATSYETVAQAAVRARLRYVQLRMKRAPRAETLRTARALRAITQGTDTLLIVNDDPALAAEVGADGAHLGQGDMPIAEARAPRPRPPPAAPPRPAASSATPPGPPSPSAASTRPASPRSSAPAPATSPSSAPSANPPTPTAPFAASKTSGAPSAPPRGVVDNFGSAADARWVSRRPTVTQPPSLRGSAADPPRVILWVLPRPKDI